LDDFIIISLKHFQLLGITTPGQEAHNPKTNPKNNKNKDFISYKIKALAKYHYSKKKKEWEDL
tara:strand:+ start:195 stop:383 length:189 start_codon:yes stop_codon:yes gene_type:complete